MLILMNAWFERFTRKHHLRTQLLLEAVGRAEAGLIDASLGGEVIKQRIPRQGRGKSSGFRAIILYRKSARAIFTYGYAKNDRPALSAEETEQFKRMAAHVLALSESQMSLLLEKNYFLEVCTDGKEISQ